MSIGASAKGVGSPERPELPDFHGSARSAAKEEADERKWEHRNDLTHPASIKQAAEFGVAHGRRDAYLREFLDEFYSEADAKRRAAMPADEPPLAEGRWADAYCAAVAEHLAFTYGLPVPEWTSSPSRFLDRPFFPCGLDSLKAILLRESPIAFRRRMTFVGSEPLYRPRKDTPRFGE